MSADSNNTETSMLFAPAELAKNNDLGGVEGKDKKKPFSDRVLDTATDAFRKVMSPERAIELASAQVMMALEISHDMALYPTKYGMTPEQVGSLPSDPIMYELVDNIGDIWEISAGHTAMRLGFVALNEILKKDSAKSLTRKVLSNEGVKKIADKLVGSDKADEVAASGELQIPDTACFWASLMTTLTVKAVHSLGYISLFGIHDHMDAPVPGMLFGQGVAAIVLATSHYAMKNREGIKDAALTTVEKAKVMGDNFIDHAAKWAIKASEVGGKMQNGVVDHLNSLIAAGDYISMETDIVKLMLEDFVNRQQERLNKIGRGNIDGEG